MLIQNNCAAVVPPTQINCCYCRDLRHIGNMSLVDLDMGDEMLERGSHS